MAVKTGAGWRVGPLMKAEAVWPWLRLGLTGGQVGVRFIALAPSLKRASPSARQPSMTARLPTIHQDERVRLQPGTRYLALPMLISATRAELAGRCHRRHALGDLLQLVKGSGFKNPSAQFGTHTHAMSEEWWRQGALGIEGPERFMAARSAGLQDFPVEGLGGPHTLDLMNLVTDQYAKHARLSGGLPGDWEVVSLEVRDLVELEGRVLVPFKVDRLLRSVEDGTLAIVDTKTSAWPNDRWKAGMSSSVQQRFYAWAAARYYGLPIHHIPLVVIEGIDKGGKVVAKGAPLYHWASMGWTDEFVDEAVGFVREMAQLDHLFVQRVWERVEEGMEDGLLGHALEVAAQWPLFNYQDCYSYNQACPYLQVCMSCPTDRVGLLRSDYSPSPETWHED